MKARDILEGTETVKAFLSRHNRSNQNKLTDLLDSWGFSYNRSTDTWYLDVTDEDGYTARISVGSAYNYKTGFKIIVTAQNTYYGKRYKYTAGWPVFLNELKRFVFMFKNNDGKITYEKLASLWNTFKVEARPWEY